jgi:hypothetical protein
MGNRRLDKIERFHTPGTFESERLKVAALNLFHPTASPPFPENRLFQIATQSRRGDPSSLNLGIGVTEDDPTVSAGLDQVTTPLLHPSLCHEGVAGIDHAR